MENLKLLNPSTVPSPTLSGGIGKTATQKALEAKRKAAKAEQKATESISSAKEQTIAKIEKKMEELKVLLGEKNIQTTKCNITENGMPFYNALTLKEKLTWKVENLDNVNYTYYGKNMNTITKEKASSVSANLVTGFGENYKNLKDIIDNIKKSKSKENKEIKYIILVKDFAGSPDLFICCFKVDGDNIKIADPVELKTQLQRGLKGQEIKESINNIIQEAISKISDQNIKDTLNRIINPSQTQATSA